MDFEDFESCLSNETYIFVYKIMRKMNMKLKVLNLGGRGGGGYGGGGYSGGGGGYSGGGGYGGGGYSGGGGGYGGGRGGGGGGGY